MLHEDRTVAVADLLPMSGETGAVYAVSNVSRTPVALGKTPALAAQTTEAGAAKPASAPSSILAWIFAALATLALVCSLAIDRRRRRLALVTSR